MWNEYKTKQNSALVHEAFLQNHQDYIREQLLLRGTLLCPACQGELRVLETAGIQSWSHVSLQNSGLTLVCESPDCWISRLPLTSDASAANCTIYSQSESLKGAAVCKEQPGFPDRPWTYLLCSQVRSCSARWLQRSQMVKNSWPSCHPLNALRPRLLHPPKWLACLRL